MLALFAIPALAVAALVAWRLSSSSSGPPTAGQLLAAQTLLAALHADDTPGNVTAVAAATNFQEDMHAHVSRWYDPATRALAVRVIAAAEWPPAWPAVAGMGAPRKVIVPLKVSSPASRKAGA